MGNASRIKKFKNAAREALDADVRAEIRAELQKIDLHFRKHLEINDKREKAIRGWLMNEVQFKMNNDFFNAMCTVDAIVEVLAEVVQIPDFAQRVDVKKVQIAEARKKAAEEKIKANLAEQAAKVEADAAPTQSQS